MSDDVDTHVLRKYNVQSKLGKGVRVKQRRHALGAACVYLHARRGKVTSVLVLSSSTLLGVWHRVESS